MGQADMHQDEKQIELWRSWYVRLSGLMFIAIAGYFLYCYFGFDRSGMELGLDSPGWQGGTDGWGVEDVLPQQPVVATDQSPDGGPPVWGEGRPSDDAGGEPGASSASSGVSDTWAQMGAKAYFSQLAYLSTLAVAVIGVLWTYLLLENTAMKVETPVEIWLFGATTAYMVCSLVLCVWGRMELVALMCERRAFNPDTPCLAAFEWGQISYFCSGLMWFMVTVWICCQRSGRKSE